MMKFKDIINLWPTCEKLGRAVGTTGLTVRAWKRRDSIPSKWWIPLEDAAKEIGQAHITVNFLASVASGKNSSPSSTS